MDKKHYVCRIHLTIIRRARMGSESIAKASWAIDSEAVRARGIIVLTKTNYLVKISRQNKFKLVKARL